MDPLRASSSLAYGSRQRGISFDSGTSMGTSLHRIQPADAFVGDTAREPLGSGSLSSGAGPGAGTETVAIDAHAPPTQEGGAAEAAAAAAAGPKRKPSRAATTYPRKRATRACLICRFRRTKCDNARPACAACVRLGADCSYQEADLSTFDPASLAILKRLDDLEGLLVHTGSSAERAPVPAGQLANKDLSTSPSVPKSEAGSAAADVFVRGRRPLVSAETVIHWPPFRDHGFPARLYPAAPPVDHAGQVDSNNNWRTSVDINLPAAESALRRFFDNIHIFNPVMEEEDVQEYIKMVRFEGIGWDAVSCLVLLIYAHGSIATSFFNEDDDAGPPSNFRQSAAFQQAESYFEAAQKRMGMLLCRSGVIDAQCFFLAGVYLMATLRPVDAWKMFVQSLACCQGLSINQEHPENVQQDRGSNAERRIYWTCFKSEQELRLELNPSQKDVWDLTYPTFYPSPPEELKIKDETAWYFYLAEIALTRLKNRILSYVYHPDTSTASTSSMEYTILDFEEQIDAWLRSLPKPLELGAANADQEEHEELRFILNGHLLDCQEVMYWQFVVDAVHGRLQPGTTAELFFRKALRVCVDRIRQNRKGFHHRHHGTWLMLRSCARSALVLLAAVRCPDLVSYIPMGWEEVVMDVARMLELWKDESSDVRDMLIIVETLLSSSPNVQ